MSRTLGGRAGLVEPLLDHALTTLLSVESALSPLLSASRHRLREVCELVGLGEVHVRGKCTRNVVVVTVPPSISPRLSFVILRDNLAA